MIDAVTDELKLALKQMIVEECDKDFEPEFIGDDMPLLGGDLDLDSLDVLQICMAVKNQYDVRIEGSADARKALKSINVLAQTIVDARR